jgi:hypothetical protein
MLLQDAQRELEDTMETQSPRARKIARTLRLYGDSNTGITTLLDGSEKKTAFINRISTLNQ